MTKIITAIYDKKAKCIGRPIFQENIEKAISGVTDALNSTNMNGEYLMPAHREHPEDYCLIQLGYLDEEKEITKFDAETGKYSKEEKITPFIFIEEKLICDFKDLEIKETKPKISAEQVYHLIDNVKKDIAEQVAQTFSQIKEEFEVQQKQLIKQKKRGFWNFNKKFNN